MLRTRSVRAPVEFSNPNDECQRNDEIRMTKLPIAQPAQFDIRALYFLRHSMSECAQDFTACWHGGLRSRTRDGNGRGSDGEANSGFNGVAFRDRGSEGP